MNKNIDIKNLKTAKRYASALCKSIDDNFDSVLSDLDLVNESIFENDDLKIFFTHPIVSLKDKKEVIVETFSEKINEKTLNFLQTLLDEGRFGIFKTILEVFKQEIDNIKNKQRMEIVSAVKLDDEQKERLNETLSKKLNKEIIFNFKEDNEILGGLIVKYEDKVLNLSLKAKFDALRKNY